MIYFLSEQRIKTDFLNDNMDSDLILNAIRESQDIYLRTIIGDSLYNTLSRLIENDIVVEPYKNLLDNFIIIYLEYKTLSSLCVTSTFKLSNMGMSQAYDSNINTQSMQNVKYLQSHYDSKASFYESRLTEYLTQNINVFPDYKNYKDITTSRSTTSQSGLFLGGARTTKTIKDIDMVHDNTVRSYVRYDIYQNLSEQQKEIARENIGVNTNGDINVDLDNYYTKSEVDTLIDNIDIPDLNNYYTKNQVNKIVDDIPIPQYTSELELDNVYSKQQTDTLISTAINNLEFPETDLSNYYTKEQTYNKSEINDLIDNVNSGEVDLSNYYKKNETYSKYEVDTLVDGVETFSGNYNDLTNKPDIYTKEQVDNLIENVDVDLSNYYTKEQVYNRNETYSSSQVDTLISQVPTFSGDYNDLTNKPTLSNVATSGSYNDLSDKPTIPTATSQLTLDNVYSKSEIDLQITEINTTLGNINNILNTI